MNKRDRISELWQECDINQIVASIIEKADIWKDNGTNFCLVYYEEQDDLMVIAERKNTKTPSFTYLFVVDGYYFLEDDEEWLYESLRNGIAEAVPKAIEELEE
jgi:hypothetical protein